jgi:hypothetical protein
MYPEYARIYDTLDGLFFFPSQAVNFGVQAGIELSRAYVKEFRHNDM